MAGGIIVAPSILSADFSSLKQEVEKIEKAGAKWLHIDVMDGHFVPNITIGPCVLKSIRPHTGLFFDTHLMIKKPEDYIEAFINAGSGLITIHNEIEGDKKKIIRKIKKAGIKAGISIKPKTPVSEIEELLPLIDLVLVMTVEPGFGGQFFMDKMLPKIERLKKLISVKNPDCLIEVDGGINDKTALKAVRAGCDVLVAGNYIFASSDPAKAFKKLQRPERI